jgi:hypothetical protein
MFIGLLNDALLKANGYVVMDHTAYPVSVRKTQLIIDSPRFFEGMAVVFDPRSHPNQDEDQRRTCENWTEIINELRTSKTYPAGREKVPWVYDRALVPVWTVRSYSDALQYASSLISLNAKWDEVGDPEFAVVLSDFNRPLLAAQVFYESTLKFSGEYFETRLLSSAQISRLVREGVGT